MEIESDSDTIDISAFSDYVSRALESGLWDGRVVTWENASDFQNEIAEKLFQCFGEEPSSFVEEQMAAQLAWLGTSHENRSLLLREIQELLVSPDGVIVQVGLRKSVSKFWKKHKKEVLVAIAIIAVVTVVVVVVVCTSGTGGAAAATLGGAAIDGLNDALERENKADPAPIPQIEAKPESDNPFISFEEADSPSNGEISYLEDGLLLNGQHFPYNQLLDSASREVFFNSLSRNEDILTAESPAVQNEVSLDIPTPRPYSCAIGGINGINTSPTDKDSHQAYLNRFAPDQNVDWVYNRSHGPLADLAEVFTMNYFGYSPNTAKELVDQWTAFHGANEDNPDAKYLQFCHSQGAIHTKNALMFLPEEIRNRIIVVAIAPATVVPKELCFESFNYASKKDIVHLGELLLPGALDSNECGTSKRTEMMLEHRKELILLDPLPNADSSDPIDHGFQNPIFRDRIEKHMKEHVNCNGTYK